MSDDILRHIEGIFEIRYDTLYEFRQIHGLTFAFKTQIVIFKDRVSSAEIAPAGIIYEENGEYYFAPLDKSSDIKEIVKEYVKDCKTK